MSSSVAVPEGAIALFSPDGKKWWANGEETSMDWASSSEVTKLVIGSLDSNDDEDDDGDGAQNAGAVEFNLPTDLATLYPNLTHLHVWGLPDLKAIPVLPASVRCLDVRKCAKLDTVPSLPALLETLILNDLPVLTASFGSNAPEFSKLREISLSDCTKLIAAEIDTLLLRTPNLRHLDLSGCSFVSVLSGRPWPRLLLDIRLDRCENLVSLPDMWPASLARLGLRSARAVHAIPPLPAGVDYLDVAYTTSLRQRLVDILTQETETGLRRARPRTLIPHGSAIPLAPSLYGETDTENVSEAALEDLELSLEGRVEDHEVKVILLGNGRCGKTSLARQWLRQGESFDREESSTHGVRLWPTTVPFRPESPRPEGPLEESSVAHLNVWDFAGQDLYHSTHRLFLQSRAIFILCYSCHPDGADTATDEKERKRAKRLVGDDDKHGIEYWKEQVRSLGRVPGLDIEPPLLVVRTKVDRDWERPAEVEASKAECPEAIAFSAKDGIGLPEIQAWVSQEAATLLGPWDARSLPKSAAAVKEALRPLLRKNEEAYLQAEQAKRGAVRVVPPNPVIPRAEFERIAGELYKTSNYRGDPFLLLKRFHADGFLYYSGDYLPESVILDQRWVTQGIYTFASPESDYRMRDFLFQHEGQFTQKDLAEGSWDEAGYNEASQRLFLSFMLECGMCFELINEEESGGPPTYAAPGFFRSREDIKELGKLADGTQPSWDQFQIEGVSESAMRSVLSQLGGSLSRALDAWRWGCRVTAAQTGAMFILDWVATPGRYLGTLKIWLCGPRDPRLYAFLRERIGGILERADGGGSRGFPRIWPVPGAEDLALARMPESPAVLHPRYVYAREIRVGISYAGKTADPLLGLIPSLLQKALDGTPGIQPRDYQADADTTNLKKFLNDLIDCDFVVCFISPEYLSSANCMAELHQLYVRGEGREHFPHWRMRMYRFPGTPLEGDRIFVKWREAWAQKVASRRERFLQECGGNQDEAEDEMSQEAVDSWYQFIAVPQNRKKFAEELKLYRAFGKTIAPPPTEEAADELAQQIVRDLLPILQEPDVIRSLIRESCGERRFDDAIALYIHLMRFEPDFSEKKVMDRLKTKVEPDPELEDLRQRALALYFEPS